MRFHPESWLSSKFSPETLLHLHVKFASLVRPAAAAACLQRRRHSCPQAACTNAESSFSLCHAAVFHQIYNDFAFTHGWNTTIYCFAVGLSGDMECVNTKVNAKHFSRSACGQWVEATAANGRITWSSWHAPLHQKKYRIRKCPRGRSRSLAFGSEGLLGVGHFISSFQKRTQKPPIPCDWFRLNS